MTEPVHKIIPQLVSLAEPLESLRLLKGNPHKGDVDATASSYHRFGQRKPIVATTDGEVSAGNTQYLAAKKLGWTHIAVVRCDDDDQMKKAYALADNRTGQLGADDDVLIDAFLSAIEDRELRDATGYNLADWQEIQDKLAELGVPERGDLSGSEKGGSSSPSASPGMGAGTVIQYALVFNNEEEQQVWFRFVRWLKKTMPNESSISGRITAFLVNILPEED